MPATSVYFVWPRFIASIAALLMLSGVSKSGSPAAKPMMSRPAAFSSRAFVVIAIVGDGLILPMAWDRKLGGKPAMTLSKKTRKLGAETYQPLGFRASRAA